MADGGRNIYIQYVKTPWWNIKISCLEKHAMGLLNSLIATKKFSDPSLESGTDIGIGKSGYSDSC